jgi:hypothetical protein
MHEGTRPPQPEATAQTLTPEQVAEIGYAVVSAHAEMPRILYKDPNIEEKRAKMIEAELYGPWPDPPPPEPDRRVALKPRYRDPQAQKREAEAYARAYSRRWVDPNT